MYISSTAKWIIFEAIRDSVMDTRPKKMVKIPWDASSQQTICLYIPNKIGNFFLSRKKIFFTRNNICKRASLHPQPYNNNMGGIHRVNPPTPPVPYNPTTATALACHSSIPPAADDCEKYAHRYIIYNV